MNRSFVTHQQDLKDALRLSEDFLLRREKGVLKELSNVPLFLEPPELAR